MSDFEDEMDIDVHPSKDITFSSDNTAKGKRSAANLPVEAEDSLPWCEITYHGAIAVLQPR
jgi:replication factor C subunit 3/5